MARRGENIFKRKDGRWEARYVSGKNEFGRTRYASVYGKSYREVKEKREKASSRQKQSETLKSSKYTFGEILDLWLSWKRVKLKEQTYRKYLYCIEKHIIPELGKIEIFDFDANMVNNFLLKKLSCGRLDGEGGLSKNYVRTMSIIIHSAVKYGVSEELCPPMKGQIYKPKSEKRDIIVLRKEEQELLERQITGNLTGENLAVYLSLHTGLRIGEVCALQWKNIDFKGNVMHVSESIVRINKDSTMSLRVGSTKSETSNRLIPITDSVAAALKEEKQRSSSPFIVSMNGSTTFMNPRTLENRYKALLKRSGLALIPYHSLRHTFATRCMECGVDVKSLSEILGHAGVNITLDIYVHPSMELKRSCMEKLEAISGH